MVKHCNATGLEGEARAFFGRGTIAKVLSCTARRAQPISRKLRPRGAPLLHRSQSSLWLGRLGRRSESLYWLLEATSTSSPPAELGHIMTWANRPAVEDRVRTRYRTDESTDIQGKRTWFHM